MSSRPERDEAAEASHSQTVSVDALPVAIIQWDAEGRVLAWNRVAERIFRWPAAEVMGKLCPVLANAVGQSALDLRSWVLAGEPLEDEEIRVKRADGATVEVSLSAAPTLTADGTLESVTAVAVNITARRQRTRALQHLATHDSLTDLQNRRAFMEAVSRLVARARRGGVRGALLLVDLDLLKQVNDRFGHRAGDELLTAVANLLRESLRPGDLLGRLGGDEFGVALPGVGPDEARRIGERLRSSIAAQRIGPGGRARSTASLGVIAIDGTCDLAELFAGADRALYRAKRSRDSVEAHLGPR